jgi:hypothetical protein
MNFNDENWLYGTKILAGESINDIEPLQEPVPFEGKLNK